MSGIAKRNGRKKRHAIPMFSLVDFQKEILFMDLMSGFYKMSDTQDIANEKNLLLVPNEGSKRKQQML